MEANLPTQAGRLLPIRLACAEFTTPIPASCPNSADCQDPANHIGPTGPFAHLGGFFYVLFGSWVCGSSGS